MYLKTLEIHGFKSFAEKTIFEFAEGVTGIVGPNGCGKSNVVDAVRWVLGETSAKALRGGEMADVIFNGTEKRKPLGMAEVTLTMADCEQALKVDYNEVSITRRVFRDGKSEYRINNTVCRLKDIMDMLMDTGIGRTAYSIMAQGQIDQILSSKPEERRAVFEEAAGITKFKKEKKDALRKLEYTEANLLRVSDVLAEQERRMNSLKRQVAKARRYQALATDIRVLDCHLSHRKFTELIAEQGELTTSIHGLEVRDTELNEKLPAYEEAVAEARESARMLEGELAELRQKANEHVNALSSAESRIAFNQERREELESRIRQNHEDISTTKEKLAQQEFDFIAANESLEQLQRVIAEKELQLAASEERANEMKHSRHQVESQLHKARSESNRSHTLIAGLQAKIESSHAQLESTRERSRLLAQEENQIKCTLEEAEAERDRLKTETDDAESRVSVSETAFLAAEKTWQETQDGLKEARSEAQEIHRSLAQRSARFEAVKQLIESGEGFEKGTQNLLKGLDEPDAFKDSVHGALASLIEVDNQSTRAIEAALGHHLHAVLVSDAKATQAIIDRLTEKKLGVAEVLAESLIPGPMGTPRKDLPEGASSWALDSVKADPRVAGVIERLLDQVLIVPDLTTALRLRDQHPDLRMITPEGVTLHCEGLIRGGATSGATTSVIELRNEAKALEKEVNGLRKREEEAQTTVQNLETALNAQRNEAELVRERVQQDKVELSTIRGQLSLATREVENAEHKVTSIRREQGDLELREKTTTDGRQQMESELASCREGLEALERECRRLQSELETHSHNEGEQAEILSEIRTELAVERRTKQAAEEQQKPMEARLSELREASIRREAEIQSFQQRIEKAAAENLRLIEESETHRVEAEDLQEEINERADGRAERLGAIEGAETQLAGIRKDLARINEQKGREEVAATKLELRLETLTQGIQERYQVDLSSFETDTHALLASIESQKALQARSGKQIVVPSSDSEGDSMDNPEDAPTLVVDGTESDEAELPGEMTGEPDWGFVEAIVTDIKRRLESMGPVNLDAIEEFEELEERHGFLRGQHDDLANSKEELLTVIDKINTETQRLFTETFAQVRLNFQAMFKELFGSKGQADLTLLDDGDPLESGIEVIAKPPGKKLQSITLLSGGERSMTAVALLFSIYMIKPSPFCVLDELDAPLDESNIGRFIKVLDRFIDRSQFIIVTHSKRTMSRADVMYGVTMEEFGVSKPVGMRLSDSLAPKHTTRGKLK